MPPRGEHSRAELRALILDAAGAISEAEGLKGLTARAIASRIGYSPGTLYNVFDDLDDLVIQLNAGTLDALHRRLSQVPHEGDPERDILALARAYVGFARHRSHHWNLVFEHTPSDGRDLPEAYHQRIGQLLALVSAALAPLFPPGEERQRDHAARVLWSAAQGITALAGAGKLARAESVDGMLRDLVTYHLRGIAASPRHPDFEVC